MGRAIVRRILMALTLVVAVAGAVALTVGERGDRETEVSVSGRDASGRSDDIPDDLVWPSPDELRSRQSVGGSHPADVSDLVRQYLLAKLGSTPGSLNETDLVLGPAEFVSDALGHIPYHDPDDRISPGKVILRRTDGPSGTWYVIGSENDRLHPFEMERDGDRRTGHLIPTIDGVAHVRMQVPGSRVLADEERDVVEKNLLRFEASSSAPVILTVLLVAKDGVISLTELGL